MADKDRPLKGQALMRSIAPLAMQAAQDAAQGATDNPLPPEVQQLLNGQTPTPAAPPGDEEQQPETDNLDQGADTTVPGNAPAAEPAAPAAPAAPAPPAPRAANVRGPRGGRPAEVPIGDGVSLLPPRQ